MPRPRNAVPTYRRHKQSGQAVVTVRTPDGNRRDILLGPFDSPASRTEYARIVAELGAGGSPIAGGDLTVAELLLRFMTHAARYYRLPDGSGSSELKDYKLSVRPLRELYGHTLAREFRPLALQTVRQQMIDAGLARPTINQRVRRITRMFGWAVANELVPPAVHQGLLAVRGLQKGRSEAREPEPVRPVPPAHVEAVCAVLRPTLRALVRFQQFTGCRPGEACGLRPAEIDRTAEPWVYRPTRHKSAGRGQARAIPIGPRAREAIRDFLTGDPDAPVFSPARAREERYTTLRAARKSRVPPSQRDRRKPEAEKQRPTAKFYTPTSYGDAIRQACEKVGIPCWHPNQLRHLHATEVRKRFGLEAAQVALGHSKADVTQVYAERNLELAAKVATEMG